MTSTTLPLTANCEGISLTIKEKSQKKSTLVSLYSMYSYIIIFNSNILKKKKNGGLLKAKMRVRLFVDFVSEYLRENKNVRETILACSCGAQVQSIL